MIKHQKTDEFHELKQEWINLSKPIRSKKEVGELINKHCLNCDYYVKNICKACSFILTKDVQRKNNVIVWGNFSCPIGEFESQVKSKGLLKLAQSYIEERKEWKKFGKPIRGQSLIDYIFDEICVKCEFFEQHTLGTRCKKCGCFLNKGTAWNKIAWGTTKCPINNWNKDTVIPKEYKKEEKTEEQSPPVKPKPPPKKPCGCGS